MSQHKEFHQPQISFRTPNRPRISPPVADQAPEKLTTKDMLEIWEYLRSIQIAKTNAMKKKLPEDPGHIKLQPPKYVQPTHRPIPPPYHFASHNQMIVSRSLAEMNSMPQSSIPGFQFVGQRPDVLHRPSPRRFHPGQMPLSPIIKPIPKTCQHRDCYAALIIYCQNNGLDKPVLTYFSKYNKIGCNFIFNNGLEFPGPLCSNQSEASELGACKALGRLRKLPPRFKNYSKAWHQRPTRMHLEGKVELEPKSFIPPSSEARGFVPPKKEQTTQERPKSLITPSSEAQGFVPPKKEQTTQEKPKQRRVRLAAKFQNA